jgi:hypothetical protein
VAIALVAPASALASKRPKYLAPPGNSALTQYLELVPTAAGPAPPSSPSAHGGASGSLTPSQRRELQHSGSEGRLLETVVGATAPRSFGAGQARAANGHRRSSGAAAAAPSAVQKPGAVSGAAAPATSLRLAGAGQSQSPVSAVLSAATGSADGGGIGILLPVLMALGVLGAGLSVVVRRRSSRGP